MSLFGENHSNGRPAGFQGSCFWSLEALWNVRIRRSDHLDSRVPPPPGFHSFLGLRCSERARLQSRAPAGRLGQATYQKATSPCDKPGNTRATRPGAQAPRAARARQATFDAPRDRCRDGLMYTCVMRHVACADTVAADVSAR